MKKWFCLLLLMTMILQLCACAEAPKQTKSRLTADLMSNVTPASPEPSVFTDDGKAALANFSVSLLQNAYENENCILSPYSLYLALAMSANGANGATLQQMEQVLGMSAEALNPNLSALAQNCGNALASANSVWFRQADGFAPNEDFLQTNADFYGADIFGAAFDENTLRDINTWIENHTDGKIDQALDEIDPNTMMFMINAITFDAKWLKPYESSDVKVGTFNASNGDEAAEMMTAQEQFYLDDGNAVGFIKPYEGAQYSFVAMLPNGDLGKYIASLNGEALLNTVKNASSERVMVTMPKFEVNDSALLNDPLSAMGMTDAFTSSADLSRMSNADLFISKVMHKTYLKVDELGTQAGAASIVSADLKGIALAPKNIVLDRPFLMGIFDNVNECFIFLGAVNSLKN